MICAIALLEQINVKNGNPVLNFFFNHIFIAKVQPGVLSKI